MRQIHGNFTTHLPTIQLAPGLSLQNLDYNQEENETVLLLNGLGVTGESWLMQPPALTRAGFRVFAQDERSFVWMERT